MTETEKIKILFFGELPPNVVHGVSISNKINTEILDQIGELTIIEEKWDLKHHNRFVFKKALNVLKSIAEIWKTAGQKHYILYYSLLYVSLFGALKQLLIILAIRLRNRKISLLLHVHRSDLAGRIESSYFFKRYINLLNRLETRFIVLSESQKIECLEYLDKIHVLYNCIDESQIYPLSIKKENSKPFKYIYLSNYIKEKGIVELLYAFIEISKTENVRLECYGSFTDKKTEQIVKTVSNKVQTININNAVYGEKKNKVLNLADALVLPSYNEGFPLVVLESLRLGKPVIVSKVGYISEIFGDKYPLYCEPGNIESIKQSLLYVLELTKDGKFSSKFENLYDNYNYKNHSENLMRIVHESIH